MVAEPGTNPRNNTRLPTRVTSIGPQRTTNANAIQKLQQVMATRFTALEQRLTVFETQTVQAYQEAKNIADRTKMM